MYTGIFEWELDQEKMADWYSHRLPAPSNLKNNQYLILEDEDGKEVDIYINTSKGLEKVNYPTIGNDFTGIVKPRNKEQRCAIDLLNRSDIPIKLITGKFGSGKTMLCVTAALEQVQKNKFEKIIFVRNNVQVKDTDQLGALPGDMYDKTLPYLLPFADHCGGIEGLEALMNEGKLEVIPLAFLRGRSIRNSILYSMESENLTKQHIQLIMGRIDEGSQLWLDGDAKQRDKMSFVESKGLETMIDRLQGNDLFGYVHLIKSERSNVAALADLLD